jgi:pimeloyl-ACP methyl ester carboxylesterase
MVSWDGMMTADTVVESLVFFPCGDISLAGVLTVPARPNGNAILLAWGAGTFPSSGRNRIRTRLARTLADDGYHCLRFDYIGVGESGGQYRTPHLSAPYTDEIVAAATWLVSNGHDRVVLVGNCFGAWSSLMAAKQVPGLVGLAISGSPVRRDHRQSIAANTSWHWWAQKLKGFPLSKLKSADRRHLYLSLVRDKASAVLGSGSRDSRFVDAICSLVDRDIPLLVIHAANSFGADVVSELDRGLGEVLERAPYPTRVAGVKDTVGTSFATQSALIDEVQTWLSDLRRSKSSGEAEMPSGGQAPAR